MAKKVTGYIKLQIPAGKATPAPPVGPALGQHGVNIVRVHKSSSTLRTADQGDLYHSCSYHCLQQTEAFSFITKDSAGSCSAQESMLTSNQVPAFRTRTKVATSHKSSDSGNR